jgi:hypothetical protein
MGPIRSNHLEEVGTPPIFFFYFSLLQILKYFLSMGHVHLFISYVYNVNEFIVFLKPVGTIWAIGQEVKGWGVCIGRNFRVGCFIPCHLICQVTKMCTS